MKLVWRWLGLVLLAGLLLQLYFVARLLKSKKLNRRTLYGQLFAQ